MNDELPSRWYRRIVFRRVYLGQAVKRQDAISTLRNHYNQRQLLGSRLQRDKHMCISLICFFLKHSVAPYLGFPFPSALMDFRNGLKKALSLSLSLSLIIILILIWVFKELDMLTKENLCSMTAEEETDVKYMLATSNNT